MCEDLPIGGEIQFKHIDFNVKIPAPFKHKKIGMIAGAFDVATFSGSNYLLELIATNIV
jgi:hypothetical protein